MAKVDKLNLFTWLKRSAVLLLISAVVCSALLASVEAAQGVSAQKDAGGELAPLNPDFVSDTSPIKDKVTGHASSPVDLSHAKGKSVTEVAQAASTAYPAKYDLRTTGEVTPVKDQGSSGSCWAFATYGSLESTQLTAQTWDFSENNLKNTHGFDWGPNDGGNCFISSAYLVRWSGPVSEANDPYDPASVSSPTGLPVEKHVQNIYYVPAKANASDLSNLKYFLTTYGAIDSSIYWGNSFFNANTNSYYYPDTRKNKAAENHDVTIVGWDDSYSRYNFTTPAPGNGAFIVKNSWGTGWGESGYFYVSYYDKYMGTDNALFTAEPTTNYDHEYQYTPLGWVSSYGYTKSKTPSTAWFANKFTAAQNENLNAVGFYASQVNSAYTIRIVDSKGTVVETQTGTIATPSYSTVKLDKPVYLAQGTTFTVQVCLTTPGYKYPIPVEYSVSGYSSKATASAGQSFISPDGKTWTDATAVNPTLNVCLDAYTTNA